MIRMEDKDEFIIEIWGKNELIAKFENEFAREIVHFAVEQYIIGAIRNSIKHDSLKDETVKEETL